MDVGGSWHEHSGYRTVRSLLFGPTVTLGWRALPEVSVGGGLAVQIGGEYDTVGDINENEGVIVWPRAFGWVDYRPMPEGALHLGALAGIGYLGVVGDYCDCGNLSGQLGANEAPSFVAAPHLGVDWSVGPSWRMGPLARLWLAPGDEAIAVEVALGLTYR